MSHYVLVSNKSWNVDAFYQRRERLPGTWSIIADRRDLTVEFLRKNSPRYVFFLHWSFIVPEQVLELAECVCFHMTDLPYGRGGSPLQNLISRGHTSTVLSALRMVRALDAGPIYAKVNLQLQGSASQIFRRCADLSLDLIETIVGEEPVPQEQTGDPVMFKRRTPAQSVMPVEGTIANIYDHIRMLDADTYPPAFVDHGSFHITFSKASLDSSGKFVDAVARIVGGCGVSDGKRL